MVEGRWGSEYKDIIWVAVKELELSCHNKGISWITEFP